MTPYRVELIDDDALPEPHAWAVVEYAGSVTAFVKASAIEWWTLEEIWAAAVMLAGRSLTVM